MNARGPMTDWKRKRLAAGISLRELERRSGINRGTISRIEDGWRATYEQAAALSRALEAADAPTPEATP